MTPLPHLRYIVAMTDDAHARLTLTIPRELSDRIEDYWHTRRLQSKAEAARKLLEQALDAAAKADAP
jgi:hypothetical protein